MRWRSTKGLTEGVRGEIIKTGVGCFYCFGFGLVVTGQGIWIRINKGGVVFVFE